MHSLSVLEKLKLYIFSVFILSIANLHCTGTYQNQIEAKNGILDLTSADYDAQNIIKLSGEWKLYWKQFVTPKIISLSPPNSERKFILKHSPSVWNDTQFFDETIGSYGYASYVIEVKLREKTSNLALYIPDIGTSYEMYVNGELLASAGKVGVSENESVAKYKPQIVLLPEGEQFDIVIHVSNYTNLWGGYWYPILFGKAETIIQRKQVQSAMSVAVCIAAMLMACYNLIFYSFRRKDPTPLLFAIHCILILLRTLTTGERLGHLLFDFISWEILNRIEYFSVFCSGPVLYAFLYRFVPNEFWKRYGLYFNLPIYTMCFLTVVAPNYVYASFLNPMLVYIFFTVIPGWMIFLLVGIVKKQKSAWVLLMGYTGLMAANINDILFTFGILDSFYMIPYGQIFLIISHSVLISKRFSNSLNESEDLSRQMKSLVTSTQKIMSSSNYTTATKSDPHYQT
ncbi:7TM-DISM domain-containing protein [Leptospira idonii]|uniref:Membrane protein n=1 Tax=Leptospira idonii TaxID=1193500 RepID=A0A4R9M546_9LEPT|nr:7TM-DISM domain-containing protein [Leptospira idonii]TGN20359.1 membrane protein [Leptospira idonii]